ncbi:regulatory protein GemA [Sphingopyxis sp. GW247-27LB]|uniref:regulatory protein GemA n=1 Tax=Sphingopyxis sp. GW247-27LB TaxID=2012632 RepID=UPI000BA7A558|nr:regulatory protein GemA [Sphingopyxis sp. GW247-27LB]PAL22657.1 GemA protein [Sphingopyxis sp. GW247-27LB]
MNWTARYRLIGLARHSTGLADDADWRPVLQREAGVDSIKNLDDAGFARLMDHFATLGFVSDKRLEAFNRSDRGDMASAGQIAKIRELWTLCTCGGGTAKGLRTFVNNKTGASDLRFVDRRGAHILITALTGWNRHNEKRATEAPQDAG